MTVRYRFIYLLFLLVSYSTLSRVASPAREIGAPVSQDSLSLDAFATTAAEHEQPLAGTRSLA